MIKLSHKDLGRLFAILTLLFGIVIFLFSYLSMTKQIGFYELNDTVLNWMIKIREPNFITISRFLTSLGSTTILTISTLIISIIWIITKRETLRPILLIGAMCFASLIILFLKSITANPRPATIHMITPIETAFSFPSGHTLGVGVFLAVLSYLVLSRNFNKRSLYIWCMFTFITTIVIAITRLYLGYHWLTDVVASIGLSLIILSIIIFTDKVVSKTITAKASS